MRQVQRFGHGRIGWCRWRTSCVSRGRSRSAGRSSATPHGQVRRSLSASLPASILQDWPGECRARRGIRPARSMSAATAVPHGLGRGRMRRTDAGGMVWLLPAQLGAVPRLALGRGHRGDTDPMCWHPPPPIGNRDVTFPGGSDRRSSRALRSRFFVRSEYRFFVPTWLWRGHRAQGESRLAAWGLRARLCALAGSGWSSCFPESTATCQRRHGRDVGN